MDFNVANFFVPTGKAIQSVAQYTPSPIFPARPTQVDSHSFSSFISIEYLQFMKKVFLSALVFLSVANGFAQKATLNHIALYVKDLKQSTAFYKDIIGLDTIPEPFHDGKHTWFSIGPKSHLHLIEGATGHSTLPKNTHLCFTVPSVESFVLALDRHKVPYEDWPGNKHSITKRVDGVKQVYFQDPDGYWIEVNDARE